MKIHYKIIIFAFALSVLGGIVWSASHYHDKYQAERLRADAAEQNANAAEAITANVIQFVNIINAISEANGKYQEQVRERKREEEARTATLQQKAANYMQRVKALKVAGYQDAEQAVREDVPVHIQDMILLESEKPEIVVLALGRNAELRKQLAEATNPVAIGRLLERIESKARIMPKAKTTAATTPTVKGSNGAVINNLDKLKARALETGDWTPYFAAKKAKK